eukprot:3127891-Prymnesium_polylepis.1
MCAHARDGRHCWVLGCWACTWGNRRRAPGARRASIPSSYMSTMSVGGSFSSLPLAAAAGSAMVAAPGARTPATSAASTAPA